MNDNIIVIENVQKYYGKGEARVKVLNNISTSIKKGDICSIEFMQERNEAFNEDTCVQNIYRILGLEEKEFLPHYVTINECLSRLDNKELEKVRKKMIYGIIRKRSFEYGKFLGEKWLLSIPNGSITASPITKAHKRILNGQEDSVKSFVDVIFSVMNGELPKTGVLRVPDAETASGGKNEKISFGESNYYISLVADGKEDFVIFHSHDGFFQFYGIGNQFVCEAWFNLGESRAYAMINPNCANIGRIELVTPFGKYTPRERDIISLEQLKTAVYEYYHNLEEADFLAKVPHEKIEL